MIREILEEAYSEGEGAVAPPDRRSAANRKAAILCVVAAVILTFNYYLKEPASFAAGTELRRLGWWTLVLVAGYLVIPGIVILAVFRERLADYGLALRGAFRGGGIYLVLLAIMIPLVFLVSKTAGFQQKYPMYVLQEGERLYPGFVLWQGMYLLQFAALEFFFRGFMVHGLKPRFGFYSVFVMTIPYCMIHFGKPPAETLAAIVAGLVLGTLSLKNGSIWLGIAIHYTVALLMDLAALWQKGVI